MLKNNCTLLVMSCDKYRTAWHPYFALLEKYWPEHPPKAVLSTETLSFSFPGIDIQCINAPADYTWSQRLQACLRTITTDYIIFSLEDFFLQAPVKSSRIEECWRYMETHPDVAVCRLKTSTNPIQVLGEEVIPEFYLAGPGVPFRLETQLALWRREILLSFLDPKENPWEFEARGTTRIQNTPYRFLWYKHPSGDNNLPELIAPYTVGTETGYGINWGHWLWNNKRLFKRNGIQVDFSELGIYNRFDIWWHSLVRKSVYQSAPGIGNRLFAFFYKAYRKISSMLKKTRK